MPAKALLAREFRLSARLALDVRRARRSPPQEGDGIPFHLVPNLAVIKPVCGPDACHRNLTFTNCPSEGIDVSHTLGLPAILASEALRPFQLHQVVPNRLPS